jgi:hypothetical protein
MNTSASFQLVAIFFNIVGAVLAVASGIGISKKQAIAILTIWGVGTVPAKIVLVQKAYSTWSFVAIACGLVCQGLSLRPMKLANGSSMLLIIAAVLSLALLIVSKWCRNTLVTPLLQFMARQKDPAGRLIDVQRALCESEEVVTNLGEFYDLPRRRREGLQTYRQRLAQRIRSLAEAS